MYVCMYVHKPRFARLAASQFRYLDLSVMCGVTLCTEVWRAIQLLSQSHDVTTLIMTPCSRHLFLGDMEIPGSPHFGTRIWIAVESRLGHR